MCGSEITMLPMIATPQMIKTGLRHFQTVLKKVNKLNGCSMSGFEKIFAKIEKSPSHVRRSGSANQSPDTSEIEKADDECKTCAD